MSVEPYEREGTMFDERFVAALAEQIAARINPQLQRRNGNHVTRLLTVNDAAAYIGLTRAVVPL